MMLCRLLSFQYIEPVTGAVLYSREFKKSLRTLASTPDAQQEFLRNSMLLELLFALLARLPNLGTGTQWRRVNFLFGGG